MRQTPDRPVPRPAVVLAVVLVVAAVVAAAYVYATTERRRSVEIVAATAFDDIVLLEVSSCGGEPTITKLDEADDDVRIVVEATTRLIGAAAECLDSIEAQLDAPLGDRVLIDESNGEAVEVQRS